MTKKALILAMLVLMSGGLFAQIGFKGGLNLAKLKLSGGGSSSTSPEITSFHVGLYGVNMTSEKFGFQYELLYSGQGGGESGADFRFNYLNVPIMMRYDVAPGLNIQFGPQVGILLSGTINGLDMKSYLNTIDFGLGFGVGADLQSGLMLGFRYVIGLTNTTTDEFNSIISGLGIPGFTMTNQVIQLSIGYRKPKAD